MGKPIRKQEKREKKRRKKTKKQGGREKKEKSQRKNTRKRERRQLKKKLKKPGETTEISSENEIKRGGKKPIFIWAPYDFNEGSVAWAP